MTKVDNPTKFASKYKLKSSRLQNFDYSTPSIYFITVCTLNKNNFFGKIINNQMELSKMGMIVKSELLKTLKIRKNIKLHQYVIMPNHIHLLMEISNIPVETPCVASLQLNKPSLQLNKPSLQTKPISIQTENKYKELNKKSNQLIPKIIQQFKSAVTRQINPKTIFFAWQTRYHDIIVKDKMELIKIRNYIINNPINWQKDKFYSRDAMHGVSTKYI